MTQTEADALAERVRAACIEAARQGYEEAAIAGLCGEGALEAALGALERLDLKPLTHSTGDGLNDPLA
ncbi:hypothetical protein [Salinisphaera hydrothermalis]|uniref:Acetyltransferase n=1 Tax=Salinisphaera hydrothermalis (strain C41B8) TaxID=1304275 RepID=A0A084IHS7_SALHC|nr:hypothetical protein [Salinisphaera hydrothermalis]KEZ76261.1 hypothetical protein C41B8_15677 [Salinisphaera hydrothermalis C41B8]